MSDRVHKNGTDKAHRYTDKTYLVHILRHDRSALAMLVLAVVLLVIIVTGSQLVVQLEVRGHGGAAGGADDTRQHGRRAGRVIPVFPHCPVRG